MYWLIDSFEAIRDFMNLGGIVLKSIAVVIFLMWVIIVERILFFRSTMREMSKEIHDSWEARQERRSWNAHQIRELLISQFSEATNRGISLIQTFVALCPLLGLLGTGFGMIEVFRVVAAEGVGQAQLLSGGISEALITTVTGLSIAIPILVAYNFFARRVEDLSVSIEHESVRLLNKLAPGQSVTLMDEVHAVHPS